MEPITLIAVISGTALVGGFVMIARRQRSERDRRTALVEKAKARAKQKVSTKEFPDTEPLSDFEFGNKLKIVDDKHLGYGMLTAAEDNIITTIFDDRLAPPLRVKPAYTVFGDYVDSIFDDRNITETIEPKF